MHEKPSFAADYAAKCACVTRWRHNNGNHDEGDDGDHVFQALSRLTLFSIFKVTSDALPLTH